MNYVLILCLFVCYRWFKHISEAAEAYKQRDGRNRRADAAAAAAAAQHELDAAEQDKTKE